MEAEPPNAAPPKRKRRWFQFSLRSLMIVVTLLAVPCANVGWQAKIVNERRRLLESVLLHQGVAYPDLSPSHSSGPLPDRSPPCIRRLMGDVWMDGIYQDAKTSDEVLERVATTFPEAIVKRIH
jgi:hypothetical protein